MAMTSDGSPGSSDAEIEADDLEIVVCDEMETVDSDDQDSAADQLDAEEESVEYFTPPRDDAIAVLQGHKESVFCVTVDPTGTFLASGGQDHVAIVWSVATGHVVFTTEGHEDSVTCVTFSWDGNYLATGDMAGGIRVWLRPSSDASSSTPWTLLMSQSVGDLLWLRWWQPSSSVKKQKGDTAKAEGPGLAVLAAGDEDGLVSVWSVSASRTGTSKSTSSKVKYFAGAGFSATAGTFYLPSIDTDRPKLLVLYKDSALRLWDLKSEQVLTSLRVISSSVTHHRAEPDEEVAEPETCVFCLAQPHPGTESIYQQQQSDLIVIGGQDYLYMVVVNQDKQDGSFSAKCLPPIHVEGCGSVEAVDFSWTHPFFAFGTVSGTICIVDTARMRVRQKWTYHDACDETSNDVGITSLLWSQTFPIFFTSASNGAVLAWHGLSGATELGSAAGPCSDPAPLRIWWGHKAMILDMALPPPTMADAGVAAAQSSDQDNKVQLLFERFVASASDDTTVRIYSTQDVLTPIL